MANVKRRAAGEGLQRRVRPRYEPEPEPSDHDGESAAGSGEEQVTDGSDREESADESDSSKESESGNDDEDASDGQDAAADIDTSRISFGALARAQASITSSSSKTRHKLSATGASRPHASENDDDESSNASEDDHQQQRDRRSSTKNEKDKAAAAAAKRTNKHAPVEMSSKRQVSRKRDVLPTAPMRAPPRDPRFMALPGTRGGSATSNNPASAAVEELKAAKAYAFLDDYRDSEMAQLRTAIAAEKKNPDRRAELKRALASMESRKLARERRAKEEALVREHRKAERELVRQGKQPFYLKKSEQKKRLLEDRYAGLSEGQREKVVARRQKKVAAKEKKSLPFARRSAA